MDNTSADRATPVSPAQVTGTDKVSQGSGASRPASAGHASLSVAANLRTSEVAPGSPAHPFAGRRSLPITPRRGSTVDAPDVDDEASDRGSDDEAGAAADPVGAGDAGAGTPAAPYASPVIVRAGGGAEAGAGADAASGLASPGNPRAHDTTGAGSEAPASPKPTSRAAPRVTPVRRSMGQHVSFSTPAGLRTPQAGMTHTAARTPRVMVPSLRLPVTGELRDTKLVVDAAVAEGRVGDAAAVLLRDLVARPADARLAVYAAQTVASLGQVDGDDRAALGAVPGLIEGLVLSMGRHVTNADVQTYSCGALQILARDCAPNQLYVVSTPGSVQALVAAMRAHTGVVAVQQQACGAILNLSIPDGNKAAVGATEGVVEGIVAAMQAHTRVPEVQRTACRALWNLATRNARNKSRIGNLAIPHVVAALESHVSVPAVVRCACGCLAVLGAQNDRNKRAMVEAGAVEPVVAAMLAHAHIGTVQERCLRTLRSLCMLADNRLEVGETAGVVNTLVAAMEGHPEDAPVIEYACATIQQLAVVRSLRRTIGAAPGALPAVVGALRAHVERSHVVERALGALHNLAATSDNQVRIIETEGALNAVVIAMTQHQSVVNVQERGCGVLIYLGSQEDLKSTVATAPGCIAAVTMAMLAHSRVTEVADRACELLWSLSFDNDTNKTLIAATPNTVGAMVTVMTRNKGVASVQEYACAAIWNLALHDTLKPAIRATYGLIEALDTARVTHPNVAAVQENAVGALSELQAGAGTPMRSVRSASKHEEEKYGEWSGWVHKCSDWLRMWRRRYCVVRTDFVVFAEDEETPPHMFIELEACVKAVKAEKSTGKSHGFEILLNRSPGSVYLYCDTQQRTERCIAAINRVIQSFTDTAKEAEGSDDDGGSNDADLTPRALALNDVDDDGAGAGAGVGVGAGGATSGASGMLGGDRDDGESKVDGAAVGATTSAPR